MMAWFDLRPTPSFADEGAEKTAALASAVSQFGIVVAKAGRGMSLHLGVHEREAHHVRSLPDVSCSRVDGPPVGTGSSGGGPGAGCGSVRPGDMVVQFRLRESLAVPLCRGADPEPCILYGHAAELDDFAVGMVGRRVPDAVVARRLGPLARAAAAPRGRGRGRGPAGAAAAAAGPLARLAASKLERGPFFLCRIFATCNGGVGAGGNAAAAGRFAPLLSSLNFTHARSGPNALVAGRPRRLRDPAPSARAGPGAPQCHPLAADPPARLPRLFGRGTAPVLSTAEMASVLALPRSMLGLQVAPGSGRTFTNVRTGAPDPAAAFSRMGEWGR